MLFACADFTARCKSCQTWTSAHGSSKKLPNHRGSDGRPRSDRAWPARAHALQGGPPRPLARSASLHCRRPAGRELPRKAHDHHQQAIGCQPCRRRPTPQWPSAAPRAQARPAPPQVVEQPGPHQCGRSRLLRAAALGEPRRRQRECGRPRLVTSHDVWECAGSRRAPATPAATRASMASPRRRGGRSARSRSTTRSTAVPTI